MARILEEEGGSVGRAARRLGIPRSTLYQKLKKQTEKLDGSAPRPSESGTLRLGSRHAGFHFLT